MSSFKGFVAGVDEILTLQLCKVGIELMCAQVVLFLVLMAEVGT